MPKLCFSKAKKRPEYPDDVNVGSSNTSNSRGFRFFFELGGALGDIGTLLPLAVALITLNHMETTSVFLVVGLTYVLSGLFFRLPIPVQPLKAVAAIAIAGGVSAGIVSAAGLIMGAFLLIMAVTGATSAVAKFFPKAVVRGIQLGVGLLLVKAGLALVSDHRVIVGGDSATVTVANFSLPLGWLLAAVCGAVFLLFLRNRKLPASLVLLGIGVLVGGIWGSFPALKTLHLGFSLPVFAVPSLSNLGTAFLLLVIPQIPLTLGNAVYATADTAKVYFGAKAKKVTPRALASSLGLANIGAGLLGGMPVCHGSGGLTAHFRLGARTGAATIMIGGLLLALALFIDGSALPILSLIPYSVLGILVIFVGVQHGLLVRDIRRAEEASVVILVGVVGLVTNNLAYGFALGIGLHHAFRSLAWWRVRRVSAP